MGSPIWNLVIFKLEILSTFLDMEEINNYVYITEVCINAEGKFVMQARQIPISISLIVWRLDWKEE